MSDFKISVLIAGYNHEAFIRDAIESTLELRYKDLEVVILDDFSSDKTYEVIKAFSSKNNLRFFRNDKNYGRSYTYRRLLYELASGDWVIMLDGDDYFVRSNFLEKAVRVIKEYPQLVAVCGGYIKDFYGKRIVRKPKERLFQDGLEVTLLYPDIVYAHGAVLYNRKKAIEINSYRAGIMSDDLETHLRLFARGGVYFIDEAVYVWRIHGKNETLRCDYEKYLDNIKTMIKMVSDDLKILRADKKDEVSKWEKRCFFKLYRIALLVYGTNKPLKIKEILLDLKPYFEPRFFLGYFLLVLVYFLFPVKILKKIVFLIRRKNHSSSKCIPPLF